MKSSRTLSRQPRLMEFGRQIRQPEELKIGMHVGQIAVGARSGRVLPTLAVLIDGSGVPGESRRNAARRLWQPQHLPQWRGKVEHIAENGLRVDLTGQLPHPDSAEHQDVDNYWNLSPTELPDVPGPTYTKATWADLGLAPIPEGMVGGMTGRHDLFSEDIGRWLPNALVELPAPNRQQ